MNTQVIKFALYHAIKNRDIEVLTLLLDECCNLYLCNSDDLYDLAHHLTGIVKQRYESLLEQVAEYKKQVYWSTPKSNFMSSRLFNYCFLHAIVKRSDIIRCFNIIILRNKARL